MGGSTKAKAVVDLTGRNESVSLHATQMKRPATVLIWNAAGLLAEKELSFQLSQESETELDVSIQEQHA